MGRVSARALIVAAAMAVAAIGASLFGPVRFPRPGGGFEVGTTTRQWRDHARRELFATDPAASRELAAQVWYPTMVTRGIRSIYLPDALEVFDSLLQALRDVTGGRTSPRHFFFASSRDRARTRSSTRPPCPARDSR